MKQIILLGLLSSLSVTTRAADVTLTPNGKAVVINGSSIVCQSTLNASSIDQASYDVVVGMARGEKLGNCTVDVAVNGVYRIYLRASPVATPILVDTISDIASTAAALRGYVKAGACL